MGGGGGVGLCPFDPPWSQNIAIYTRYSSMEHKMHFFLLAHFHDRDGDLCEILQQ